MATVKMKSNIAGPDSIVATIGDLATFEDQVSDDLIAAGAAEAYERGIIEVDSVVLGTIPIVAAVQIKESDSGKVIFADGAGIVVSLPPTVNGLSYVIVSKHGSDGGGGLTIVPKSSDRLIGMAFDSSDGQALINTLITAEDGDAITLIGDGVDGWFITTIAGIWAMVV